MPGIRKLPWFFAGILFFPLTINIWPSPPISIPRVVIYTFLGTVFWLPKDFGREFNKYPIKSGTIFLFFMLLLITLFDKNGDAAKFFKMLDLFIKNFLVMFLTYYYVRSEKDVKYIYKVILWFLFAFCLYGLSNFFTKTNEYYNFFVNVFNGNNLANLYMASTERFRISSFAWHPIYYGFILAIFLLLTVYLIYQKNSDRGNKAFNIVLFFLLAINLLLTNSRTPLLAFLLGYGIYFLFTGSLKYKIKIVLFSGFLVSLILFFLPNTVKIFTDSVNTFTSHGAELKGSSIEMRLVQLNASLKQFNKSPITGNGIGYIKEGLGFSGDPTLSTSDSDFAGFESYFFKLLIEQGLCGMVGNAVLFINLFAFFYHYARQKVSNEVGILSIAMLITFLAFIFGTGDMGSFILFMSVMGINMRYVMLLNESQDELVFEELAYLDEEYVTS